MLVSPHVIRNLGEARDATEEFKRKVAAAAEALRQENKEERLERLEQVPVPPTAVPTPPQVVPTPPQKESPPQTEPKPEPQSRMDLIEPYGNLPRQQITADGSADEIRSPISYASDPEVVEPPAQEKVVVLEASKPAQTQKLAYQGSQSPGLWVVQVAAFASEADAKNLAQELQTKGYDTRVVPARVNGRTWYRTTVGRLESQDQAKKLQQILKTKENYPAAFVTYQ